ncbi:plasmid mobilization protein [Duncaniella muricolitica]|uniref:plasmid mobilization protein n=2 Tax=Bacteroidales TaxID=171549 RepID=UPI00244DD462|nr:hypothetical protein [Duncaniella muricolitica]
MTSTMKVTHTNKGGRPSKPTEERRNRVVTIKLTEAEYSDLRKRAKASGVKIAEFVRHGAFRLTIVSRLTETEMKISQQILRLSPDFNQAITWLNTLKMHRAAQKLLKVIDTLWEILGKLRPNREADYVCKNT